MAGETFFAGAHPSACIDQHAIERNCTNILSGLVFWRVIENAVKSFGEDSYWGALQVACSRSRNERRRERRKKRLRNIGSFELNKNGVPEVVGNSALAGV